MIRTLRWVCILDYVHGTNVITMMETQEKAGGSGVRERRQEGAVPLPVKSQGHGQRLELEESRTQSPPEPPEGRRLCPHLGLSSVTLISDLWPLNCKRIKRLL